MAVTKNIISHQISNFQSTAGLTNPAVTFTNSLTLSITLNHIY
ncbi:MAG: hypothetical protein Q8L04_07345 [Ignavibacteria bacterium]|nr:hypothetical protein [Ignavibacteria bacterium]